MSISKEELATHRNLRDRHEEKSLLYLNEFLSNRCRNHNFSITTPTDEWSHYDNIITIDGKDIKEETKVRYITIDKYPTLALSRDKIYGEDSASLFIFFYPLSNKVATITKNTILNNIDEIDTTKRSVTEYQFSGNDNKKEESLLMIPLTLFDVFDMKF